jgi:hypothetical protein
VSTYAADFYNVTTGNNQSDPSVPGYSAHHGLGSGDRARHAERGRAGAGSGITLTASSRGRLLTPAPRHVVGSEICRFETWTVNVPLLAR